MTTEELALFKRLVEAVERITAVGGSSSHVAAVADLDSPYGDEIVKFNPRDWGGDPIKGLRMSQCPPEALLALASALDYFAEKNAGVKLDNGKPKSDYDKRSAARARAWAERIKGGWTPPAADPEPFQDDDGGRW